MLYTQINSLQDISFIKIALLKIKMSSNLVSDLNSPEAIEKYKEILIANGVTDKVSKVVVKDAGLQGDGMCSQTLYVAVTFEDDKIKPLNLFVKLNTSSPAQSSFIVECKFFEKEALVFNEYMTNVKKLLKLKGAEELAEILPKCYFGSEKMIVLENLVLDAGYAMMDKEKPHDLEAVKFSVETLAKFHAISIAMINEAGGPQKFFEQYPNLNLESYHQPTVKAMMTPMAENGISTNVKILEKFNIPGKDEVVASIKTHSGKVYQSMTDCLTLEPGTFAVFNHGDYWTNNMMFLKNDQGQIIGHKAIDLQCTRYNSPCVDLAYYLYTSVQADARRENLQSILELYLNTLKQTSSRLGHDIRLTYDELFLAYRKKLHFGYWIGFCVQNAVGRAIMKEMNAEEMNEAGDFAGQFNAAFNRWIDAHPEQIEKLAEQLICLVKEYDGLRL